IVCGQPRSGHESAFPAPAKRCRRPRRRNGSRSRMESISSSALFLFVEARRPLVLDAIDLGHAQAEWKLDKAKGILKDKLDVALSRTLLFRFLPTRARTGTDDAELCHFRRG